MPRRVVAYLGLGSNLGDRAANLWNALALLSQLAGFQVTRVSPLYESSPLGPVQQGDFLNAVLAGRTALSPTELLPALQAIERSLGRRATVRWGPRIIDLDLLLYGRLRVRTDDLVVPHPELWRRRFVLAPLADVLPPGRMRRRVAAALPELGDTQPVWPYQPDRPGAGPEMVWPLGDGL